MSELEDEAYFDTLDPELNAVSAAALDATVATLSSDRTALPERHGHRPRGRAGHAGAPPGGRADRRRRGPPRRDLHGARRPHPRRRARARPAPHDAPRGDDAEPRGAHHRGPGGLRRLLHERGGLSNRAADRCRGPARGCGHRQRHPALAGRPLPGDRPEHAPRRPHQARRTRSTWAEVARNAIGADTARRSYVSGSAATRHSSASPSATCSTTIVARFPDHEALVARHQNVRYTYRQLREHVDRCARALMALGVAKGERVGIWAPNCAEWTITQFATAKIGAILVNINPSYRGHEVQYALRQSGCAYLVIAPQLQDVGLHRHALRAGSRAARGRSGPAGRGGAARSARGDPARRRAVAGDADLGRAAGHGRWRGRRRAGRAAAAAGVRRAHQHPVHQRDHGLSQGRHPQPPQHPQQRLLRGRADALHRPRPPGDPGAPLSLLRHGDGQPRLRDPRRDHDLSERRLRCPGGAGGCPGRAGDGALRRADHVHRRAGPSGLRALRPHAACAPASWRARRARSRS